MASQLLPARHAGRAGISAGPARASPWMGWEGGAGPWLPVGISAAAGARALAAGTSQGATSAGSMREAADLGDTLGNTPWHPSCISIAPSHHALLQNQLHQHCLGERGVGRHWRGPEMCHIHPWEGLSFPWSHPHPPAGCHPQRTGTRKPNLGGGAPAVTPSAGRFGDSGAIGRGVPTRHVWPRQAARALAAPAWRCLEGDRRLYSLLGVLITIAKPPERRSCGCQHVRKVPSRARGDAGWGPNPLCAGERNANRGASIPAAPSPVFTVPTAAWGRGRPRPSSRSSSPSRSAAICSGPSSQYSSYWFLREEVNAQELLWLARMERDDQPHTGDSPGPFQASASCGFSPGSGFSGSFGLSGVSLDSAVGERRQKVTRGGRQRQHPTGVRTR